MDAELTLDHPVLHTTRTPLRPPAGRSWGMRDVAKLAQVSHQTVSRVFNAPDKVSARTRERVLKAVEALDYRPSAAARALTTQRSGVIGIVDSGAEFFGATLLLNHVERAVRQHAYATYVTIVENDTIDSVQAGFSRLLDRDVEGIVVMGTTHDMIEAAQRASTSVPVAMVSTSSSSSRALVHVGVDSVAAAATATQHLVDQGCSRIAHISGPRTWPEAEDRIEGWRIALASNDVAPGGLYEGDWLPECGYQIGRQILAEAGVDGVFVANDHMALGLMCALAEHGVRIPEDIAVVGFDDVLGASVFNPPLTTMHQPFDKLADQTVTCLLDLIDGRDALHTSLTAELVIRRSSLRTLGGDHPTLGT